MKIIVQVEAAKHLPEPLTDLQRGALCDELCKRPWTIEQIRKRGDSVAATNTFNSIGFQWWFNAQKVYSHEEAMEIAGRKFKQLVLEEVIKGLDPTDADIARESGLEGLWRSRLINAVRKHEDRLERNVKILRAELAQLGIIQRREVIREAVRREIFSRYDEMLATNIHMEWVACQVGPIVEEWMNKRP